jgi:hypothetical protein
MKKLVLAVAISTLLGCSLSDADEPTTVIRKLNKVLNLMPLKS